MRDRGALTLLVVAAALTVASTSTEASAWARDPGDFFVSTRADYFLATAAAPLAPDRAASRFERFETNTYTEFGLSRIVTIGGKAVYGTTNFFDGATTSSASGFSELEGFIQFAALRGEHGALSFKVSGASPSRLEAGPRPELVGDGADIEARALYGRNLADHPFKIFASAEAGYRKRFGDAADQIRADALIGLEPATRLLILAEIFSTTSLRNGAPGGADYDVVKFQPSAVWRASRRFSLQAGVTLEAAGRNLLLGNTYFIGFWSVF